MTVWWRLIRKVWAAVSSVADFLAVPVLTVTTLAAAALLLSNFLWNHSLEKLAGNAPPDAPQQPSEKALSAAKKALILRRGLAEIVNNTKECNSIDASALVEKYIKIGDEISKAKKILALNGAEIVDSEHMEAEYWIGPGELERRFFPFGARC